MNMEKTFTLPNAWLGGYFELSIELGSRSDERLHRALNSLWSHPTLDGCYERHKVEPWNQRRLDSPDPDGMLKHKLFGIAQLPNGKPVACASHIVVGGNSSPDLLHFGVPMGALGYSYPVGAYPFDDGLQLDWRAPINEWLRQIGESIFVSIKFRLGLVGHEVGGLAFAEDIAKNGIPDERWEGYLWPESGNLSWYPPNMGAPMTLGKKLT
jgi:hypothetical protein